MGPVVGRFDTVLFAVGMVGAGLIAIPVLAGAVAFPLAELFNWREGLNKSLRSAPGFYSALSAAVVMGVALNFFGVNPFKALLYAAVLQGLLAPVLGPRRSWNLIGGRPAWRISILWCSEM